MNPGPAPRPPTNGPRLNLTPSTSGVPGNQNSISSPITRSASNLSGATYQGSTYSGSTYGSSTTSSMGNASVVSLPIRTTGGSDGQGGVAIIKEGFAYVRESKGIFGTQWKHRHIILRKEHIDFHKPKDAKLAYQIFLKDVLAVGRVEAPGNIFEIRRNASGLSTAPGDDDNGAKVTNVKTNSDDDLYEWIDFIYAKCPGMGGVSNPTNFSHAVHVGFDPTTGEFVGLPNEWSKLLNSSAITKEDYERNPQAVFEVLEFYSDITKRQDDPAYSSLTPTPPALANQNKQLGGAPGASIAPPRPLPPSQQRNNSYSNASTPSPYGQRQVTPPEQQQQRNQMAAMSPNYNPDPRRMDEQQSYGKSSAQQPIGGFSSNPAGDKYVATRQAPPRPQPPSNGPLRAQRQAPAAPSPANGQRPGLATQQSSASLRQGAPQDAKSARADQNYQRSDSPGPKYVPNVAPQPLQTRQQPSNQSPSRIPAPVNQIKPLNVSTKQPTGGPAQNGSPKSDAVRAAEAALTAKPTPAERKQDVRMSTMSESEVMARLREVVSKGNPDGSYSKQKKIGQGASGSVYVAKVKSDATSDVARRVLREQGSYAQVAIKQMDLAHQPRKELIVNEIMVMKDSRHPNIVNFLDSFLTKGGAELWVVMEFMEGGALTDVIDNNSNITEDQISTICLEVSFFLGLYKSTWLTLHRPAEDWNIFTSRASFTEISNQTTFFWMLVEMSRLVSSPMSIS
jgi:hypothetical protein